MSPRRMALALALAFALVGCSRGTTELGGTLGEPGQPIDLAPGEAWGQSFVAPSGGLSRVAVMAMSAKPASHVRLRLLADGPGGKTIAEIVAPVERLMAEGSLWLRFDPLADSARRGYYLEITLEEGTLRLFATPSDAYPAGEAYHTGQRQPYDLLFGIYGTPRPGAGMWHRLLDDRPLAVCYLGTLVVLLAGAVGTLAQKRGT